MTSCIVLLLVALVGADASTPEDALRAVRGQARLVRESSTQLLEALRQPDRKALGDALERFVRAHDGLADRLATAHIALGAIDVRLEIAQEQLGRLRVASAQAPGGAPPGPAPRAEALARLDAAYRRHEAASPAERAALRDEIRDLVLHVEQLDRWDTAYAGGSLPLVGADRVAELERDVAALTLQRDLQDRQLERAANAVAARLRDLPAELERLALLHRAHETLPRAELDKLRSGNDALVDLLTQAGTARLDAASIPPGPSPTPVDDADDPLARARQLLGATPSPAR